MVLERLIPSRLHLAARVNRVEDRAVQTGVSTDVFFIDWERPGTDTPAARQKRIP